MHPLWAESLNRDATADATTDAAATADLTAAKQIWIFKSFSGITQGITRESPDALNDRCWRFLSDSEVVQESLSKDRYFVSWRGIDSGSGISNWFKDLAQFIIYKKQL